MQRNVNFNTNSVLQGTCTKLHYVNAIRSSSFWILSYIYVKQIVKKASNKIIPSYLIQSWTSARNKVPCILKRRLVVVIHKLKVQSLIRKPVTFNPLNPELNPICYLLALLGTHHFLHVSRIRVKLLTLRPLMSYIYGAPILDVSRSHTTTQHSR